MKLMKNSESGQALVLALILLALGALLIIPTLNLTNTSAKYHQLIGSKTLEGYSADAGMEYALCKLYNAPGEYSVTPLDESFNLNGRTVSVTANYTGSGRYKLTSTATSADGRSTTIEANVNLSAGVFLYALASKNDLLIQSQTVVTSSPVPGNGDICSNGAITLTGSKAVIYGDARAVGAINADPGQIQGLRYPYYDPVVFPGDYTQLYKTMAQETGDIRESETISTTQPLGPVYYNGDLTVQGNTVVYLTGTIYVTGKLKVTGGARFEGEHNIAVEGDVRFEGGGVNSTHLPIVTANPGSITLTQSTVDAVVYAPNNSVDLISLTRLNGAVGGLEVRCGKTLVVWSATLNGRADLPGGELKTISYSYK